MHKTMWLTSSIKIFSISFDLWTNLSSTCFKNVFKHELTNLKQIIQRNNTYVYEMLTLREILVIPSLINHLKYCLTYRFLSSEGNFLLFPLEMFTQQKQYLLIAMKLTSCVIKHNASKMVESKWCVDIWFWFQIISVASMGFM